MSAYLKTLGTAADRLARAAKLRNEDRKKYLMGEFVLAQMHKTGLPPALLTYNSTTFDSWLTRPEDRAVFGLPS